VRLLRRAGRVTFAALEVRNYRRYLAGQSISLVGTWMQMIAQSWLVLELTGSSLYVGAIVAAQTLPVLLLGPYGGVIADRSDKRRLMVILQSLMGLQALALGLLTVTHTIRFWEVAVLAAALGLNSAFENPARQSFMLELVGPDHLRNAVSLNSVVVNVARTIGPAVAGIMIATVGVGVCFLANAGSFVAVLFSLAMLDRSLLGPSTRTARAHGQLREGLSYIRETPALAVPLLMTAAIGMLAYEFQVSLPLFDTEALHHGAEGYGLMTAAMGVGAVAGGLATAALGRTGTKPLVLAAGAFGLFIVLASLAPSLPLELVALVFTGAASVGFMSTSNSTLQLASVPAMRGRVMSLWFVAFQGSTPIGGPLIGWIIAEQGARAGLGVGGIACLVVAAAAALTLRSGGGLTGHGMRDRVRSA
jgi:MFS family permease